MLLFHVFTALSQKKVNNYRPPLLSGNCESKEKISREKQVKNFLQKWARCVLKKAPWWCIFQENEIFTWNTIVEQNTQSWNMIIIWSGSHQLFLFPVLINLSQELPPDTEALGMSSHKAPTGWCRGQKLKQEEWCVVGRSSLVFVWMQAFQNSGIS